MNTRDDTIIYSIFCLLLDASGIAAEMGELRVSTFCKRLARRTDERWNRRLTWSLGEDEDEADVR